MKREDSGLRCRCRCRCRCHCRTKCNIFRVSLVAGPIRPSSEREEKYSDGDRQLQDVHIVHTAHTNHGKDLSKELSRHFATDAWR